MRRQVKKANATSLEHINKLVQKSVNIVAKNLLLEATCKRSFPHTCTCLMYILLNCAPHVHLSLHFSYMSVHKKPIHCCLQDVTARVELVSVEMRDHCLTNQVLWKIHCPGQSVSTSCVPLHPYLNETEVDQGLTDCNASQESKTNKILYKINFGTCVWMLNEFSCSVHEDDIWTYIVNKFNFNWLNYTPKHSQYNVYDCIIRDGSLFMGMTGSDNWKQLFDFFLTPIVESCQNF